MHGPVIFSRDCLDAVFTDRQKIPEILSQKSGWRVQEVERTRNDPCEVISGVPTKIPVSMKDAAMFRFAAFAVALFATTTSFAGDLLTIAFEDTTFMMNGKQEKCDLYYILLGDNGSLDRGDLVQISQRHDDRQHYGIEKGRFSANDKLNRLTIHWPAQPGEKIGSVEKAQLKVTDPDLVRIVYEIDQHSDQSQVGQKLRARVVDYEQLPQRVRNAMAPVLLEKLSPEERVMYHRIQAQQLKATSAIIKAYFE